MVENLEATACGHPAKTNIGCVRLAMSAIWTRVCIVSMGCTATVAMHAAHAATSDRIRYLN